MYIRKPIIAYAGAYPGYGSQQGSLKLRSIHLLFCLFCVFGLQAQYFHHVYGNNLGQFSSGMATTSLTKVGHIIAGAGNQGVFGSGNTISVAKTDPDGRFTSAQDFKNEYALYNSNNILLNAGDPQVLELSAGGKYVIAGDYLNTNASIYGVYYIELDLTGNVTAAYDFPASQMVGVNSFKKSTSNPSEFYVVGTTWNSTAADAFVLKINSSGTYLWDQTYDIAANQDAAMDMVEDPLNPGMGVVVGNTGNGGLSDAMLFYIDLNGGPLPSPNALLYGTGVSDDRFNRIKNAVSPAPGFIIAGVTTSRGPSSIGVEVPWLINIDGATLGINWSNIYIMNSMSNTSGNLYDVIERLNTSGQYEYYAVGMIEENSPTDYNMLLMKVNSGGFWSPGRQVNYGTADVQMGFRIDMNNSGTANGVSLYGVSHSQTIANLGSKEQLYIVKAYFNGESGCQEDIRDPMSSAGPGFMGMANIFTASVFFPTSDLIDVSIVSPISDNEECYNRTLRFGNNNLVAQTENPPADVDDHTLKVTTNVAATGLMSVNILQQTTEAQAVTVKIYDLLGQVFYSAQTELQNGNNALPPSGILSHMSTGMYRLEIEGDKVHQSTMILVH